MYIVESVRIDKNQSFLRKVINWKSDKGEGKFIDQKGRYLIIPEVLEFGKVLNENQFKELVNKHNINLF